MADRGIVLRLIVVLAMAAAAAVAVVRVVGTEKEAAPSAQPPAGQTPAGQTPRPAGPDLRALMPTAQEALPGTTRHENEVDSLTVGFHCLGTGGENPLHRTGLRNVSFGSLIADPECDAPGVAFEPNGQQVFHDITGDGYLDALVAYSCTSTTSAQPAKIYVFDGRHSRAERPRQLAVLPPESGLERYLRDISITVDGRVVRLQADGISEDASLCCPDQVVRQTFTWNGSGFVAGAVKVSPLR